MTFRSIPNGRFEHVGTRWVILAAWLYFAFVVYGSLVPFHFYDLTPGGAWSQFIHIRFLNLGMAARADWIANLVLYVPLGFLLRAALAERGPRYASPSALGLCLITAVAVEFLQVYAPARTVSLNDLMAEAVGALLGVLAYRFSGNPVSGLVERLAAGGGATLRTALLLYTAAYLILSVFPFDFVLSGAELSAKFAAAHSHAAFLAGGCERLVRCFAKLAAEIIAAVPIGAWLGLRARRGSSVNVLGALLLGTVLGVAIEGAQLLLVSGVSQGASVLTRAFGVTAGFAATCAFDREQLHRWRGYRHWLVAIAALAYVPMLAAVNGLFSGSWRGMEAAAAELTKLHWIPFYYHYYTSEASAFASLLAVGTMYAPVGVGYWIWYASGRSGQGFSFVPGVLSACLALLMEAGKLFIEPRRPDPTDLLVAFGAGLLAYGATQLLSSRSWRTAAVDAPDTDPRPAYDSLRFPGRVLQVWPAIAVLAVIALNWPFAPVPILLGTLTYAAILWFRPGWWAWALPLLLPVLNLSVWSGQLFFDEFDLVVLATLAVSGLRIPPPSVRYVHDRTFSLILSLLALSYGIALVRGIWPLQNLDGNAFSTYFSHYNALRAVKGYVFALLLGWVMRRWRGAQPFAWDTRWNGGLIGGLLAFAAVVVWERYLFPGVLDFNEHYRVSGSFSTLHTGGPQVEAYVVLTLPVAVAWLWQLRARWSGSALIAVVALGVYTVWVSYSRAGYLGMGVAASVLLFIEVLRNQSPNNIRRAATATLALTIIGVGTLFAASGGYLQERFQRSHADLERRLQHWRLALGVMPAGWDSAIFGTGLGTFPEAYLVRNPAGDLPGNYRYVEENGNRFLRLGGGGMLYFGQRVSVRPDHRYRLDFDVRASAAGVLGMHLCEKFITQSYNCRNIRWTAQQAGRWQHVRTTVDTGALPVSSGRWRPVEFAFSAGGSNIVFDLDNITLGRPNLIHNGDFSRAWERWFFTTDDMWPWRVENLWLQLYFEQGWFGMLIFAALILLHVKRLIGAAWSGDVVSLGLLASVAGWLTIGIFSSVLDDPKLALWFYLLVLYGESRLLRPATASALTRHGRRASV